MSYMKVYMDLKAKNPTLSYKELMVLHTKAMTQPKVVSSIPKAVSTKKTYSCSICGKKYVRKTYYLKHIKSCQPAKVLDMGTWGITMTITQNVNGKAYNITKDVKGYTKPTEVVMMLEKWSKTKSHDITPKHNASQINNADEIIPNKLRFDFKDLAPIKKWKCSCGKVLKEIALCSKCGKVASKSQRI